MTAWHEEMIVRGHNAFESEDAYDSAIACLSGNATCLVADLRDYERNYSIVELAIACITENCSAGAVSVSGHARADLMGRSIDAQIFPSADILTKFMRGTVVTCPSKRSGALTATFFRRVDGTLLPVEITCTNDAVMGESGSPLMLIQVTPGVDKFHNGPQLQSVSKMANCDSLDPNADLERSVPPTSCPAIVRQLRLHDKGPVHLEYPFLMRLRLITLDEIVETYGHNVAQILLSMIEVRIRRTLGKEDSVLKMAGGEFVVLIRGTTDGDEIQMRIDRIFRGLQDSFLVLGVAIYVSGQFDMSMSFLVRYVSNHGFGNAKHDRRHVDDGRTGCNRKSNGDCERRPERPAHGDGITTCLG